MMDLSLALPQIFPLTMSLLPEAQSQELIREFSSEWDGDQIHFFPMWLRQRKFSGAVVEVADYEYLKHSLRQQNFSQSKTQAPLQLNSSLRWIPVKASAQVLKKPEGVYALWKWQDDLRELKISKEQASILDRLQEDQILLRSELNERENQVLNELLDLKIVLQNLKAAELSS